MLRLPPPDAVHELLQLVPIRHPVHLTRQVGELPTCIPESVDFV